MGWDGKGWEGEGRAGKGRAGQGRVGQGLWAAAVEVGGWIGWMDG